MFSFANIDKIQHSFAQRYVAVRLEASSSSGLGHLKRCLSLCEHLERYSLYPIFVSSSDSLDTLSAVLSPKTPVIVLPSTKDENEDAALTLSELSKYRTQLSFVIVDNYRLGKEWEKKIASLDAFVVAIDDMAREHLADIVIDYSCLPSISSRYNEKVQPNSELLLGPQFALLDQRYAALRSKSTDSNVGKSDILVCFGGSDQAGEVTKTISALEPLVSSMDLQGNIVIGPIYCNRDSLHDWCAKFPRWKCIENTKEMPQLIANAKLSIGGGGVMNFERACLGLPTVVIAIADNQIPSCEAFHKKGALLYLGTSAETSVETLRDACVDLLTNKSRYSQMSICGREIIDGRGAKRVSGHLISRLIELKEGGDDYCKKIYEWRNDKQNRNFSLSPEPISWETHAAWYKDMVASSNHELLIGYLDMAPVGVVRFDYDPPSALVSIYMVPDHHFRGLGLPLLLRGLKYLQKKHPTLITVNAKIRHDNSASIRIFSDADFRMISEEKGTLTYVKRFER